MMRRGDCVRDTRRAMRSQLRHRSGSFPSEARSFRCRLVTAYRVQIGYAFN